MGAEAGERRLEVGSSMVESVHFLCSFLPPVSGVNAVHSGAIVLLGVEEAAQPRGEVEAVQVDKGFRSNALLKSESNPSTEVLSEPSEMSSEEPMVFVGRQSDLTPLHDVWHSARPLTPRALPSRREKDRS